MRCRIALALAAVLCSACGTIRAEEVAFYHGGIALRGTLYHATGEPPHPGVVLVHGDGAETRAGYAWLAQKFAASGISALVYDKRGTGSSTGDWRTAGFDGLAGDAAAAVRFLRSRPDIKPPAVGLWGGSQGGWIAPIAAVQAGDIAFLIVKAGPAVSPAKKAASTSVGRVQRAGYSQPVLDRVEALMQQQFEILRTDTGWQGLADSAQRARTEPWYPHVAVMRHSTWASSWMTYGRDIDFEPADVLVRIDAPVLYVLGELDAEIPWSPTAAVLDSLRNRHNRDITYRVLRGADHQLELPRRVSFRPRFAEGYPEDMIEWATRTAALNR